MRLEAHERQLLGELVAEMRLLLEADIPASDAVMERLFPQAYEEEEDERAYRELIGNELHARKLAVLGTVDQALSSGAPEIALHGDDLDSWLAWLTDVRLAIGTRVEITEEKMGAELDPSDPEAAALSVLHWLGWMQGSILEAIGEVEP